MSRTRGWKESDLLDRRVARDRNKALAKITKKTKVKYGNKKAMFDGITFDSTKERNHYLVLRHRRDKGEIVDLECQKPFDLIVNGNLVCRYIADFSFMENNIHVVHDVKGYKKGGAYSVFRIKAKLLQALTGITVIEI